MMSEPKPGDREAVEMERLLRQAFEAGATWVAQVDDPARSPWSLDRGFAEFREKHLRAARRPAPQVLFGEWPVDCQQRAFVDGVAWWQFAKRGATLWASERNEAEAEAVKRYGEPIPAPGPDGA